MPPLPQRPLHHTASLVEHLDHLPPSEPVAGPVAVHAGQPQGLVGVDVAHPAHQGLVEEHPLDPRGTTARAGHERGLVELGVQGVAGDVRDLRRQRGAAGRDEQAAEHPLVDEAQLASLVGAGQPEANPQVSLVGGLGWLHEELPAHPEVAQQGVTVVEGQPEVLAPAAHRLDAAAGQRRREARGAARVTAYRPRVEHLHGVDGGPEDVPLQAGPDDLDLGQLGHQSSTVAASGSALAASRSALARISA